ncbi:SMI1/KNR4 family protein [Actinomadura litoris]|uniref:SMI1/KNR4 family protein n=1 Tax=Actinomadura litoris TaxID=2678616 RepID=A0A7K1KXW5_9ACTN|nr:SMI1/KNR4 family protein [Actinomadura litoris]MUN36999.1 SMI1/KNR4 family protein [Actinomadura litoris]
MFEENDCYTGPEVCTALIDRAERGLGYRLPRRYVEVLRRRNGGVLRKRCYPTEFSTSWASDHFCVEVLLGIGGEWGIDSPSGMGSACLIREWGYPDIGVVVFMTPSAGHDAVMLDYSGCGPLGEPVVAYVDEDRVPRRVADSFSGFLDGLVLCERFAGDD